MMSTTALQVWTQNSISAWRNTKDIFCYPVNWTSLYYYFRSEWTKKKIDDYADFGHTFNTGIQ